MLENSVLFVTTGNVRGVLGRLVAQNHSRPTLLESFSQPLSASLGAERVLHGFHIQAEAIVSRLSRSPLTVSCQESLQKPF